MTEVDSCAKKNLVFPIIFDFNSNVDFRILYVDAMSKKLNSMEKFKKMLNS